MLEKKTQKESESEKPGRKWVQELPGRQQAEGSQLPDKNYDENILIYNNNQYITSLLF